MGCLKLEHSVFSTPLRVVHNDLKVSAKSYAGAYSYGYQGSEINQETHNNSNQYTTEFRQLDARFGRWFSVDPVFRPFISPYNSMDGNPIKLVDKFGDTPSVENFQKAFSIVSKTKWPKYYPPQLPGAPKTEQKGGMHWWLNYFGQHYSTPETDGYLNVAFTSVQINTAQKVFNDAANNYDERLWTSAVPSKRLNQLIAYINGAEAAGKQQFRLDCQLAAYLIQLIALKEELGTDKFNELYESQSKTLVRNTFKKKKDGTFNKKKPIQQEFQQLYYLFDETKFGGIDLPGHTTATTTFSIDEKKKGWDHLSGSSSITKALIKTPVEETDPAFIKEFIVKIGDNRFYANGLRAGNVGEDGKRTNVGTDGRENVFTREELEASGYYVDKVYEYTTD